MAAPNDFAECGLKLAAVVYARLGAAVHLRETGRLPDVLGGPWDAAAMKGVMRERGTDPALTPDEQLVYDAIAREDRPPGGAPRPVGH